jgi:hypothetical protein
MSLHKRGQWWYGDSQADIRDELTRVGKLNEYVPTQFADAKCSCGSTVFSLKIDENEGAAVRSCVICSQSHPIGDSGEYLEDANLEECACPCGEEKFEITVGVHLYDGSEDVKWFYVGCRCSFCGIAANYGDWKSEFEDYRALLALV